MIVVPAGASGSAKRIRPTRFWPKSTSTAPDGAVLTSTACTTWVRRTGGPVGATNVAVSSSASSTGVHAVSSKPGVDQPGSSRRRSTDSPGYSPVEVIGPSVVDRQEPSVLTTVRLPSGCSTSSWTNAPVRSP